MRQSNGLSFDIFGCDCLGPLDGPYGLSSAIAPDFGFALAVVVATGAGGGGGGASAVVGAAGVRAPLFGAVAGFDARRVLASPFATFGAGVASVGAGAAGGGVAAAAVAESAGAADAGASGAALAIALAVALGACDGSSFAASRLQAANVRSKRSESRRILEILSCTREL